MSPCKYINNDTTAQICLLVFTVGCVRGVTCLLLPIDRDARRDDAEGDTDTHAPVKDFKEVIFQLLSECFWRWNSYFWASTGWPSSHCLRSGKFRHPAWTSGIKSTGGFNRPDGSPCIAKVMLTCQGAFLRSASWSAGIPCRSARPRCGSTGPSVPARPASVGASAAQATSGKFDF